MLLNADLFVCLLRRSGVFERYDVGVSVSTSASRLNELTGGERVARNAASAVRS